MQIACIVRQKGQPERRGIIIGDRGDKFVIYLPDTDCEVEVSKLYVYPDLFRGSAEQKTVSATKELRKRRKKGTGTAYIYRRTIVRKGNEYTEFYYRYRNKSGKIVGIYIPQSLLAKIRAAESQKLPVVEVLKILKK